MTLKNPSRDHQVTSNQQKITDKLTKNNMLRNTIIFVAILFVVLVLALTFPLALSKSGDDHRDREDDQPMTLTQWCDQTPHPGPCRHFMPYSPDSLDSSVIPRSDFQRILVRAAMARASEARQGLLGLGPMETGHAKTALSDCLKLFDDTTYHLNRTLATADAGPADAQTWLSAASTNVDTCLSGSLELNVSSLVAPVAAGFNVTELISDGLAINAAMARRDEKGFDGGGDDFPGWVSGRERRLLGSRSGSGYGVGFVVGKDGSGQFGTVQEAINAAGRRRVKSRVVIRVKRGVYRENIEVGIGNDNIMLVGDGMRFTIITGGRSVRGGYTTYSSATAGIDGLRFIARGITFRNTAGPQKEQAVALRSSSDLSVFHRCAFEGYQDTLMVHSQRQFYKECYVYGTVDFIFGNAAVVFQNCVINVRKPLKGQVNVITAHGRNDPYQNTAISIQNSQIRAGPDLRPVAHKFKTYLGRPWKLYSRTVFMKCYLDRLVSPSGWLEWNRSGFGLKTVYYGEYRNVGPASSTRRRVRWPGFHVITSRREASRFSAGSLIAGKSWLPATGVPYNLGV